MDLRKIGLLAILVLSMFWNINARDVTDNYLSSKPGGNTLDKTTWEKLKDDYKYKTIEIDTTQRIGDGPRIPKISPMVNWLKMLAYLFVFALIVLVLYLLFRYGYIGNKELKNKKTQFSILENPEDINSLDIDPLLAEALKNQDYRLALRLKYLALLKMLSNQGILRWRRELTNRHYADQLRETSLYSLFIRTSFIYESGWYGDYAVDANTYATAAKLYDQIENLTKEYV